MVIEPLNNLLRWLPIPEYQLGTGSNQNEKRSLEGEEVAHEDRRVFGFVEGSSGSEMSECEMMRMAMVEPVVVLEDVMIVKGSQRAEDQIIVQALERFRLDWMQRVHQHPSSLRPLGEKIELDSA